MILKNKWTITNLLMLLGILGLSACGSRLPECTDRLGCVTILPDEPIELGVLQSLSGNMTPVGNTQLNSIKLAIQQREGQLLGHPLVIHTEDELCSEEGGANGALKLAANPQIIAVWGTTCSNAATEASQILSEAGRVMVSATNTAPSLTEVGSKAASDWYVGYFRTTYNGARVGEMAAKFAFEQLGLKRAATLNDGDAFTQGLSEAFEQEFWELGGEVVLSGVVNKGDRNMKPILRSIATSQSQILFMPLFPAEATELLRQLRQMPDLSNLVLITGDSLQSDPVLTAIGEDGVGLYFVSFAWPDQEALAQLKQAYEAEYGSPPEHPYYSFAYDAANIVLEAISTVAVRSPNGTLQVGRQALRDALYNTSNFPGVTGSLSCNQFGDCASGHFSILQFNDPAAGLDGLNANRVYLYEPNP
ncbi:branched-chain amino acid ABC transporter substrate-binding protein [Roseofilum sp. BLCC_M154]|uniref:Branched-chain amino acid ABC transporter substrate-binding protein n=1 Tax=Roseofilum acuticapitatum BLCC-M154 TaxID=3022444 RepID=A0ABT7AMQ0_9CYAN|nr:branched-chain amino acid ABC transporter substrate-binding protein [Roseofilum acuticapitatum]MDJ1168179.1 branched-chain amino acid ABC transporter substrate-binding protein [Roseofilum acuticapitatum BLCC-M154]